MRAHHITIKNPIKEIAQKLSNPEISLSDYLQIDQDGVILQAYRPHEFSENFKLRSVRGNIIDFLEEHSNVCFYTTPRVPGDAGEQFCYGCEVRAKAHLAYQKFMESNPDLVKYGFISGKVIIAPEAVLDIFEQRP